MPHTGQRFVMRNRKRFNHLRAGRRWRKTTCVMQILVEEALRTRQSYMWCAPTYDQSRTAMDEIKKALRNVAEFNESRMSATLAGGGAILFRSLDNSDNLRGKTAAGVVIDEAAETEGDAWYEVLRPMLIDTNGWAWFVYTPKGRNWIFNEWQLAMTRDDTALFHAPTLGVEIVGGTLTRKTHALENPFIEFAEIKQLYETMPETSFRQEILAEFVEVGGGVFRNVSQCATATAQSAASLNHTYVAGVDWALTTDYTVLTIMDATTNEVVHIDRFSGVEYALQRQRIAATCARFNCAVIVAEENAMGKPNNDFLRQHGLPVRDFTTTNASKSTLIENLAAAFEHRHIRILNNAHLLGELSAYEGKRLAGGGVQYSAPSGLHDDMVMSLALAWHAAARGNYAQLDGEIIRSVAAGGRF
jgi:hypothetical protein